MKTKMFKKLNNIQKMKKFKDILMKKSSITEDIADIIIHSIDIENQYQIIICDSKKFLESCVLKNIRVEEPTLSKIIKEEATVIYGAVSFGKEVYYKDNVNNTLSDVGFYDAKFDDRKINIIKKARNTITSGCSEWYYSIEIYIPEK